MYLTVAQTKAFRWRQHCALPVVQLSFLSGFCRLLSHLPTRGETQSFGVRARRSAGQARAGRQDGTGERGTQPCPCMGKHLTGVAEGNPVVLSFAYGPLSVGTQEQPEPGHLVDDFQRTDKDKHCLGYVHV